MERDPGARDATGKEAFFAHIGCCLSENPKIILGRRTRNEKDWNIRSLKRGRRQKALAYRR